MCLKVMVDAKALGLICVSKLWWMLRSWDAMYLKIVVWLSDNMPSAINCAPANPVMEVEFFGVGI